MANFNVFEEYTYESLLADALSGVPDSIDKRQGSVIYDAIAPACYELALMYTELAQIIKKLDIDNLEGEELQRFIKPRTGQERKPATRSITSVIVSGAAGAKIEKGDLFESDFVNFKSLEDRVLDESGQATVIIAAEKLGSIGNVPENAINRLVTPIKGILDVYNPQPAINGYDEETDDELRQRYYDKLQRPGKAGNKYHYEEWAKEVVGVGSVSVEPKWNGPLTVKVTIVDSNRQPANQDLIDAVANHIEQERPFGAVVTVVTATPKPINLSVNIIKNTNYTNEEIQTNLENSLVGYLKEISFVGSYISYAKIGSMVLETDGVLDYSNLTINNGTANIQVNSNEVPVIGVVTCTF